jgi:hypothetical protein
MLRSIAFRMSPVLATLTFSMVANASTISVSTPTGSNIGGQAVNSTATFTTGDGTVMIDLFNNLTANQVNDVSQNLSDLSFTLSGTFATGLVTDTNRTYTGTLINVGTNGVVTAGTGTFNGWDFSNTGSTFVLEDLGSTAGPAQTIIGGTAGSSTAYSNANGSIDNNDPHNPFIQGVAHFTLNIAGVTASTNVTGATFSFGTTLGNNIPGTGFSTPVPEPVSSALMGIGLVSLFFLRRRIRS